MDDPATEIEAIVQELTMGSIHSQKVTLESYFTPDSTFVHPFCAVYGNRDHILSIFQWYRVMSPKTRARVNTITFDEPNRLLYLNITQDFQIWPLRFIYNAHVTLTTVLSLEKGVNLNRGGGIRGNDEVKKKWYITKQNDLYQVDEFIKFVLPTLGLGPLLVWIWHTFATWACVIGAAIGVPLSQLFLGPLIQAAKIEKRTANANGQPSSSTRLKGSSTPAELARETAQAARNGTSVPLSLQEPTYTPTSAQLERAGIDPSILDSPSPAS